MSSPNARLFFRPPIVLWLLIPLSGCQLQEQPASVRVPAVATRFTTNPMPTQLGGAPLIPTVAALPNLKVGLAMQSFNDPLHVPFATELGTILIRELQLSGGSMQVQPMTVRPKAFATPAFHGPTSRNVISVSFQEAMETLPPDLPPLPIGDPGVRPVVDQILVVRVLEYRPWFPMRASLEMTVLAGESNEPIFATTASWNAADYGLVEPKPRRKKRHLWFGEAQPCDPSPGHNSPDALMHEIAGDITAWYTAALNPPPPPKARRGWLNNNCK
ncbi:MAG TPA: hypothetical protein PLR25_21465 [Planctomycetaceae bacterium]|nr:hypothetical protein [Planctomycetaceae bacterium]